MSSAREKEMCTETQKQGKPNYEILLLQPRVNNCDIRKRVIGLWLLMGFKLPETRMSHSKCKQLNDALIPTVPHVLERKVFISER